MELIYVWINEYRCIHRQGFCLSPEFAVEMEDIGDGRYRLKIRDNGTASIFHDGPVTNLTVLVGENGSGKTTFLEYVQDLTCFSESIFRTGEGCYDSLARQQADGSKNVIVLREKGSLWVYTNLPKQAVEIDEKVKGSQVKVVNLCGDGEKAGRMLSNGDGFYDITSLYMTNSSYHLLGGSSSHKGLKSLVFSPVSLKAVSGTFFESICPEGRRLQKNRQTPNLLWLYSSFLKEQKGEGEFQQMCDVLFYHRLLESGAFREYAGFVQTDLIVNVKSVYDVFPGRWEDGEGRTGPAEAYETIGDRFGRLLNAYNRRLAKQSPAYVLKADFIAEYSLIHEDILKGAKTAVPGNDAETGAVPGKEEGAVAVPGRETGTAAPKQRQKAGPEWIEKVFDELGRQFDSASRREQGEEDFYFEEAYWEVQEFCELIEKLEPCENLVPVEDMAYKSGVHMTLDSQGGDHWRKNIRPEDLGKSSYAKICWFLAERIRENSRTRKGERLYGSFVLRYIAVGNLLFSSGERAFQNLMSWMAMGAELWETTGTEEYVPKKNVLLCMDEIDLYCHPAWQRDFIDNMLRIMRQAYRDYSVQVLLTTHSPLCLGDVPRENIIYLRNEGGRTVVDRDEHRQTFACNLYELLDDAFYLGHDTMGRFAKDYVDRLIRDIDTIQSGRDSSYRELQVRIERIGDSFLRRKLEQQLERQWRRMAPVRQQISRLEADRERLDRQIDKLRRQEEQKWKQT